MEETKSIVEAGSALFADIELVKVIVSFVGVLLTALAAGVIGYFAREAPMKTVKLEQLKFITQLTKDRAWKDPANNFVIEEIFRDYFKVFIPIEIIKYICMSKSRYYGFLFYSRVRKFIEFDEGIFIVPSRIITLFIRATIFAWAVLMLHIASVFLGLGYTVLTVENGISGLVILVSFISCLASLGFAYAFYIGFDRGLDLGTEMNSFMREFQGNVVVRSTCATLKERWPRAFLLAFPLILLGIFHYWLWVQYDFSR